VLSNFSPLMVAKPMKQWSLLVEVSESRYRKVPASRQKLRKLVIDGLRRSGMLPEAATIVTVWDKRLEYGYPVPYVERNMHMHAADAALRQHGIWSRGRFGSWKYEVANQDHSCMLGVDAVDSMLFGGNAAGREATFNAPNKVNVQYRNYDFDFEPAKLAREAGRKHTFAKPPRRLRRLPQWDFVSYHCKEADGWTSTVRKLMTSLPDETKWLVHSYEECGMADSKRPMLEMLREGLDHLDRIPHKAPGRPQSGWVRHILAHYRKLPNLLVFVRGNVPASSAAFAAKSIETALAKMGEFHMWGTHMAELPSGMRPLFCKKIWPLVQRARSFSKSCPERVLTMASSLFFASRKRIHAVPEAVWQEVAALLAEPANGEDLGQLIDFAWHMLLGQPAVLQGRLMSTH